MEKRNFTYHAGSPHSYGQIRSYGEQVELEKIEREKQECAIVRRACDAFFERRGLPIASPVDPVDWNHDLIEEASAAFA